MKFSFLNPPPCFKPPNNSIEKPFTSSEINTVHLSPLEFLKLPDFPNQFSLQRFENSLTDEKEDILGLNFTVLTFKQI